MLESRYGAARDGDDRQGNGACHGDVAGLFSGIRVLKLPAQIDCKHSDPSYDMVGMKGRSRVW